jgi:protein scribble
VASIIAQALKKQEEQSSDLPDATTANNSEMNNDQVPATNNSVEMLIKFERADKGLGLSIAGGQGSTPYKDTDEGIFISRVTPGGPADIAGLRKDDKVLSVNGYTCVDIDHYRAVDILKAAGSNIDMRIVRDVPGATAAAIPTQNGHHSTTSPIADDSASLSSLSQRSLLNKSNSAVSPSWTEVAKSPAGSSGMSAMSTKLERIYATIIREHSSGSFGFSISGGKGADQFVENDDSVYISKIAEAGPAHRDGKIQVGDKIVQVLSFFPNKPDKAWLIFEPILF